MKHRHLTDDAGLTLAAIDDILDRGDPTDWSDLWQVIEGDPYGPVAADVVRICNAHAMYGTSRLWPAMISQAQQERRAAR